MSVEVTNNIYKSAEDAQIAELKIANDVVAMIAGIAATEVEGVDCILGNNNKESIEKIGKKNLSKGIVLKMDNNSVYVRVRIVLKYGYSAPKVCVAVQEKVKSSIQNMTRLEVTNVDVSVCGMELA